MSVCPICGRDHAPVTFELPDGTRTHCPIPVASAAIEAEIVADITRTGDRPDE